jgi:putative flippase GtrA
MKETLKQAAKHRVSLFACIGIVNTIIDILLLNILRIATHTTTDQRTKLIVLNLVSASSVAVFSFFMNKRFVFKATHTKHTMLAPFLLVTLSSIFILQSLVIAFSLDRFGSLARIFQDIASSFNIPILQHATINFYETNIAKIIATLGSMTWNYVWYNRVIFRKQSEGSRKS